MIAAAILALKQNRFTVAAGFFDDEYREFARIVYEAMRE
jgi:hypothetical protein